MRQMNLFRTILFLLFGVLISGCEKSPDGSKLDSQLMVYSLNVALVPGGTEKVIACAYDGNGVPEMFTATSDNQNIAVVTKSDTVITVTGVSYGTTKIMINSNSGKSREVPVTIYDPQVLETDGLLIKFSQTFQSIWNPKPVGGVISCWQPVTTDGFVPLGSLCLPNGNNPDGKYGVMVVKAKSGSNAIASPVDYTLLVDGSSDNSPDFDASFWIPVPPAGYKAMGIVVIAGYAKPSLNYVACVREDLTLPGKCGSKIFTERLQWTSTGYKNLCSWWIEPPVSIAHEDAYISTGTFVAISPQYYTEPPPLSNAVMNVLKIKLPMLAETPFQNYVPSMTGLERPPDETVPILAREMLVPCTIISDPKFPGTSSLMSKISSTPFYRLERQVFYKLLGHWYNTTSIVQHNSYTKEYGFSQTESDELYSETSISITAEAGISFKMANAGIAATVTRSFGYSSMTSVTEFTNESFESGIDCPPGKAVAIWQQYNRFVFKRHNGSVIETVKVWEFGVNSFVTDEYPDD